MLQLHHALEPKLEEKQKMYALASLYAHSSTSGARSSGLVGFLARGGAKRCLCPGRRPPVARGRTTSSARSSGRVASCPKRTTWQAPAALLAPKNLSRSLGLACEADGWTEVFLS